MDIQDGIKFLTKKYSSYDWYDSVGLDKYKRYVVYVTTMNLEVMQAVQQTLEGKQVLISYANSKPENLKKYTTEIDWNRPSFALLLPVEVPSEELLLDEDSIIDVEELIIELDRLEKVCGSNGLQSIFYEVHDGKNAVTNLGSKYPEVKKDMQKLYDQYGFDIIYDELDG